MIKLMMQKNELVFTEVENRLTLLTCLDVYQEYKQWTPLKANQVTRDHKKKAQIWKRIRDSFK